MGVEKRLFSDIMLFGPTGYVFSFVAKYFKWELSDERPYGSI